MPPLGPIKRKVLIYYLQRLDFQGPFSGGNHQFMIKGEITLRIPNPHKSDIGRGFKVNKLLTNPCAYDILIMQMEVRFHVMREWLSGRASPCQGESRGFDPRLPLPFLCKMWHGDVAKW